MTRREAEDLVFDLVHAFGEYEVHSGRHLYRNHYFEMRERVVVALMTVTPADGKPTDNIEGGA